MAVLQCPVAKSIQLVSRYKCLVDQSLGGYGYTDVVMKSLRRIDFDTGEGGGQRSPVGAVLARDKAGCDLV